MTGEIAEELLKKNCCSGKQKQEKNCKRYLPHHITACMRLRLRMGVNGRQKQQNFYAKKYSVPKMNFPEYSSVLFRRASSSLFCRKVLQTELWGLSKDKTTCQIPWVFRISVKSETHGFLHLEEISDMEVVNKTTYKRNENKYMLTKKPHCHILKIV